MNSIRLIWPLILESVVLVFVLGLLLRIFVVNSKKLEVYKFKMWDSTRRSQAFLQQVDQEFDIMNKCAKSIKNVFLNFSKVYKQISKGTKTLEEAITEAKTNLPDDLKSKFSRAFLLMEDVESVDELFSENTSDYCIMKSCRPILSEEEEDIKSLSKCSETRSQRSGDL